MSKDISEYAREVVKDWPPLSAGQLAVIRGVFEESRQAQIQNADEGDDFDALREVTENE